MYWEELQQDVMMSSTSEYFLCVLITGLLIGTLVLAAVKHLENQDKIIDLLSQIKLEKEKE